MWNQLNSSNQLILNQAKILCPKLAGKSSLLHDLFIAVKARKENNLANSK